MAYVLIGFLYKSRTDLGGGLEELQADISSLKTDAL